MKKYNSLVFHIIGAKKEVCIASNEIFQYTREKYFRSKIIQKNKLLWELDNNVNQTIYINECNNITCEEIKNIHKSLYYRYDRNPIFSYTFYINQPPFFCPYIDKVYTLDDKTHVKHKLLHPFLFGKTHVKYYYLR